MSKRRYAIPFLLLILTVAVYNLIYALPQSPGTAAKAAEVVAATSSILEEVSQLRGLKVLSEVKSGVKTRTEIEREVVRNFEDAYKPEEISIINKTLIAYGLAPKDFRYREFMIRLMTEQVAGFYRPKSKELYIADWNELRLQRPVMAHELVHALQDQHFNLMRFDDWPRGDGDREAAIHALIEGDATGIMYNYQLKPMGSDITRLPNISGFADQTLSTADKEDQQVFHSAPAALRESLIFPYVYGAGFVQELVRRRGWNGVSRAFTDLPQSTEQILHCEKYLIAENPMNIRLPDVSSMLGADWKLLDADRNGEFGYYLILSEFINKKDARKSAEGWGGDQSTIYENLKSGQTLLAHMSVWDTQSDAEEFFQAYLKRTMKRYPEAKELKQSSGSSRRIISPEGEALIILKGNSVLVIEGAPAAEADRAAEAIIKAGQI